MDVFMWLVYVYVCERVCVSVCVYVSVRASCMCVTRVCVYMRGCVYVSICVCGCVSMWSESV